MAIKAVLTDVDGCLTDGTVLVGDMGRRFNTFDGEGFARLKRRNILVALISRSTSEEIHRRARWLRAEFYRGIEQKEEFVKRFVGSIGLSKEEICFFGNDVMDLKAMQAVGFVACPDDAHYRVIEYCATEETKGQGYVCGRDGGDGAFRELVDYLIEHDLIG